MIFVRLRRLTTNFISIVILLFPSAQFGLFARAQSSAKTQEDFSKRETNLTARAIVAENGVLLQWRTDFELDILGFEVYRIDDGKRALANRTIIPGSIFISGPGIPLRAGYAYQWFDRNGATDSVYYIESVSGQGKRNSSAAIAPVPLRTLPVSEQSAVFPGARSSGDSESTPPALLKEYPAGVRDLQPLATEGATENQWLVASQTALKISVKKDGWYRVTQSQMASAGFNPVVDIKNLSLFGDGQEIGILTSKDVGQLGTGDYVEFYGLGMDTPTTDTRIYYLIAGTASGKRISGEIRTTGSSYAPPPSTYTPPRIDSADRAWFAPLINLASPGVSPSPSGDRADRPAPPAAINRTETIPDLPIARPSRSKTVAPPGSTAVAPNESKAVEVMPSPAITGPLARKNSGAVGRPKAAVRKGQKGGNLRKRHQPMARKAHVRFKKHYSHAVMDASASTLSFNYRVELKSRRFYVYTILNGDAENYFGDVITAVNGTGGLITENLPVHNVQLAASAPAQLEVALQGIYPPSAAHQINVFLNDVLLGSVSFDGLNHGVQTFSVLPSQLQEGNNTIKMAQVLPPGTTSDTVCFDYLKLTYPHSYTADSDSLRFNLRSTQSLKVDGFSTPNVRLLDVSDPTAVKLIRPIVETSGSSYTITVPSSGVSAKAGRVMYALPEGQFLQPAGFSLNQPSTLNQSSNGADLVIIAYKDFIPSLAPLVAQRQGQGLRVVVADIEDVFDEFSFGAHSPQAIKSFVARALGQWATPPRYLLLVGDASLDPRDYEGYVALNGARDFVPSKLVDTAFGEACSDDSLADLDGDGIPELAVGRLPVQTVAQANLVVSKIVNFSPANVPKTAMLVADTQGSYFFNFEQADDDVAALLPASMTKQKIYRRLQQSQTLTGTVITDSNSTSVTGTGTLFTTQLVVGSEIDKNTGELLGIVASILNNTSLTLTATARATYSGAYSMPPDSVAHTNIVNTFNQGLALVNYSGHGNANAWTGASILQTSDAMALTNGNHLPFVVVMDCLNGRFDFPDINSLGEAFLKAPGGGAVAVWASSGLTIPNGQHDMSTRMYQLIYGGPPIAVGDAIRQSKSATGDLDVRRTWIFLGDPTIKVW